MNTAAQALRTAHGGGGSGVHLQALAAPAIPIIIISSSSSLRGLPGQLSLRAGLGFTAAVAKFVQAWPRG